MYNLLLQRKATFITVLFSLIFSISITAQEKKWEFSNSTPREAVKTHLYFLDAQNYNPTLAAYTLGGDYSIIKKKRLAKRLKIILLKHKIKLEDISNKRKFLFAENKLVLFNDIPQIYLIRTKNKWQYAPESVSLIDSIYNATFFFQSGNQVDKIDQDIRKAVKRESTKLDSLPVQIDLSTPYATIVSHLLFLEDSSYNPALAAKTINFDKEDSVEEESLAIKLKQLFLGSQHQVYNFSELSKDSNYTDTISGKHIYYPNPLIQELFLEKVGDNWYYSNSTSKLINSAHENMYSIDAEQIFKFSDRFKIWAGGESEIIFNDVRLWQFYMLLYFVVIGLLIYLFNHFILKRVAYFFLRKSKYKRPFYRTLNSLIFIVFFNIVKTYLPALEMSMDEMHIIHKVVHVIIIFFTTLLSFIIVNILKIRFTKENIPISQQGLLIFLILIIKVIIFIVSLLTIINALDFNLVNILAGLSIGGFALALGAQDTIKNFFGSLMIFADHSFSVGDYISNDKVSGTVEEVGLRTTKIRTFHNSVVTVPNSKLADDNIDNLGRRKYRRFSTKIIIDFNTPTEKIDLFVEKIRAEIKKHPDTRKDFYMVYMNNFSTYGVEILLYVFFAVPEWEQEMKGKHYLMSKILDFAKELDVSFAIPPR